MPTMSMNRVIHGAFRRDLDRFVTALDAFPDGDADRAAALGRAWANFDQQLTHHHEGEHEVAWPHLERAGVSRQMLDQMDAEHEVMAGALEIAREEMNGLVRDPSRHRAEAAREAMHGLRVATLTHLDHEERELEAFYVTNADHPEVKAMEGEFRKQSPAVGGRFFAWILDGITPDARAAIAVPGPVLAVLTGLFGRSYRREVAPVWR
jgi:hemerythrin-like domain-containing protein